jgi:hypothetical protein
MNARRLVALSTTAAVLAACSSGGSSSVPRPKPSTGSGSTSQTKHPANTKLTLKFSSSFLRLKKAKAPATAASAKHRNPSYIDPTNNIGGTNYLEIQVSSSGNNGTSNTYMALIDYPISTTESTQTIPLYLAPGNDYVTIQEFGSVGYPDEYTPGYLLAQGSGSISVSEAGTNNLGVTMQLVLGTAEYYIYTASTGYPSFVSGSNASAYLTGADASSIAVLSNATNPTVAGYFVQQSEAATYPLCFNQNQQLFFLPTDDMAGTSAFYDNPTFSATNALSSGLPYATYSGASQPGSSTLGPSALGGYTVNFDSAGDPIIVSATFPNGVLLDPTGGSYPTYGPISFTAGGLLNIVQPSYPNYAVEIGEIGAPDSPMCPAPEYAPESTRRAR